MSSGQKRKILGILLVLVAAGAGLDHVYRRAPQQRLTQCKQNLRELGTALEMHSTDANGKYPDALAKLVPKYLPSLPHCPSAQADTYSDGAQFGPDAPANKERHEDYYLVYCAGSHHEEAGVGPDQPSWNGIYALMGRPEDHYD